MDVKEIQFGQDTAERKKWFRGLSFSHPAKMNLGLQIYLIERYTKPGDTILDPMAGSGTLLVACALGRNVILVELESKFCDMARQNWEKIQSLGPMLGYSIGTAQIICGDARELPKVLADVCIFSPPHGMSLSGQTNEKSIDQRKKRLEKLGRTTKDSAILRCIRANNAIKGFGSGYSDSPSNIGNLKYGSIDKVIMSPPYANPRDHDCKKEEQYENARVGDNKQRHGRSTFRGRYTESVSAVICSPPYEAAIAGSGIGCNGKNPEEEKLPREYSKSKENIGNLKNQSYLEAMNIVYRKCHAVLPPGGLIVLVTKNFIRDKKIVDLAADTIKLCESVGFKLKERLARKLTHQSFWRIIYYQKFPDVQRLTHEDILIFEKDTEYQGEDY